MDFPSRGPHRHKAGALEGCTKRRSGVSALEQRARVESRCLKPDGRTRGRTNVTLLGAHQRDTHARTRGRTSRALDSYRYTRDTRICANCHIAKPRKTN